MKLKGIFSSKDRKILWHNFFSLSLLQLVTLFLPLITLPYVLRVIGYEKYGLISLATALVAYFQAIVDYSFKVTAVRDVVKHKNNLKKLSIIYSRVMIVKLSLLFVSLTFITLIVNIYSPFYAEKKLFFYSGLSLIGVVIFPEWFFQGIEKMKYITLVNISIRIAFTLSIFIFIKEQSDYLLLPLLTSIGLFFSGLVGQYILFKSFKIRFLILPPKNIKKIIKKNFPIFINQFIPNLYNNSTSFLLGIMVNTEMLGVYTAIRKVIDLCVVLLNVVSRVFFPFLNREKEAFIHYRNLMFTLVLIGLILLFSGKNFIFMYLGLLDPLALPVLLIMGFSVVGFVAYDVYGLNYFIVKRQDKLVMMNTISSSVIAFAGAVPLIYYFGIIGAALSLFFGRMLMGGGMFFYYIWKVKVGAQ